MRPCTQCRSLVPVDQKFKMCDACREKGRQNSAKFHARRKRSKFKTNIYDPRAHLANDDTENKENDGIGVDPWDMTRGRTKMEFADSKRGKVAVKTTLSEKITSLDMMRKRINMKFADVRAKGNIPVKNLESKVVT